MTSLPSEPPRSPALRILRAIGRFVVGIFVVGYAILDELLFPLFRPLVRWIGHFRVFELIGGVIQRSPPYLVLLYLAVPFVLVEPLKIFAIYWGAVGHPIQGLLTLIFAQVVSIFTLDRIYHVGKGQLLRIGWFARLMGWLVALRDRVFGWVKATPAWQAVAAMARGIRQWFAGIAASLR